MSQIRGRKVLETVLFVVLWMSSDVGKLGFTACTNGRDGVPASGRRLRPGSHFAHPRTSLQPDGSLSRTVSVRLAAFDAWPDSLLDLSSRLRSPPSLAPWGCPGHRQLLAVLPVLFLLGIWTHITTLCLVLHKCPFFFTPP